MRLTVHEAHQRFGDLARIRNGVTTWIEVELPAGVYKPVIENGFVLVGYDWHPKENRDDRQD